MARRLNIWATVVVLLALGLRLWRAALRWDEIALAYAAYIQPVVEQGWGFVGLHPPLYAWILELLDKAWGAPAAWLIWGAVCSTGAVALLAYRVHPLPALVLALDPFQLAYAAEVNNYPLLCFAVAWIVVARHRLELGGHWVWLVLAGLVASWTHLLGGWIAGIAWLTLGPRRWRLVLLGLGTLLVGALPFWGPVTALLGLETTRSQGGLELRTLWERLWPVAGPTVGLFVVALGALRRWEGQLFAGCLLGLVLALVGGAAASHQLPYWVVLGAPAAVAVWRVLPWGTVLFAGVGAMQTLPGELERTQRLRADLARTRAIDVALRSVPPDWPLWLVSPAWLTDDDKTATSDVLWRFSPFRPMPAVTNLHDYVDPRAGQPRRMQGRIVHTSVNLETLVVHPVIRQHLERYGGVGIVLYDHGYANDYPGMVKSALRPFDPTCTWIGDDVGIGQDLFCEVRR